jgi:hypothetical protein
MKLDARVSSGRFDRRRGYVATHPSGSITALSLSGLRKRIDARLRSKDVRLLLKRAPA